jgi:hypothetical protein
MQNIQTDAFGERRLIQKPVALRLFESLANSGGRNGLEFELHG